MTKRLLQLSLTSVAAAQFSTAGAKQPNILFIFSDDHALKAISAYGGPLAKVAPTPHIDQLAKDGAIFKNSFCANSICGPSRACILTGKHSHVNGFMKNGQHFNGEQWTFPKEMKKAGYSTALIGKWHLHGQPTGFDYWEILPGQGNYYNPVFIQMNGKKEKFDGYATDITTEKAIKWLDSRDKSKPFVLMCQHKAPHRTFSPALRHLGCFDDVEIPQPKTLFDDYSTRSKTLEQNKMSIDKHMHWTYDLKIRKEEREGINLPGPDGLWAIEYKRMTPAQKKKWDDYYGPHNQEFLNNFKAGKLSAKQVTEWKYQRYMKNYLGTIKAVDESVGKLTKYLKDNGLDENTIVIYSSDQGFYLGEHGWYDKRWMFEESLQMPFVIKWPGVVKPGSRPKALIQNIDYAPTFLEMASIKSEEQVQGKSIVPILKAADKDTPVDWRKSIYYAYYQAGGEHNVPAQFGVRTQTHKLFHLPKTNEWQMFDLVDDPDEIHNIYGKPEHAELQKTLTEEYHKLRKQYKAPATN